MNRYLKYGLIGIGGIGLLAAGGVAYVAATFDPNDYKPQIIQAVKDSTQRTLRLDGNIRLTFYPNIGAELGKVSLSEFNSEQEFISVENAQVSLALLPLLSRQIVVDEVAVKGLRMTLVKFKDGRTNIDDLANKDAGPADQGAAPPSQPVQFNIASVRIEDTELAYRDEVAGTQYAVKNLNLATGRIANGVPSKIELSANIQASQLKLDVTTQMKATLTIDLEQNAYRVSGLDFQAKGSVLDITGLTVQASGDAGANLAAQEFSASRLQASVSGLKGKDRFGAKLDMPELGLASDRYSSGKISLDATLDGAMGNIAASLVLPGLEGNAQSFRSSALTLSVDVKQPEQTIKLKLSSPLQGSLAAQQFSLPGLVLAASATGDKLPGKSVNSEMKGSVHVDASKQQVQANLSGGLLQSQVSATLAVNGFAAPSVRFNLDIDRFDAGLYLPKTAEVEPPKAQAAAAPEQPLDLSALKALDLQGSVRIGALKASNVKLSQLKLDMKAADGILDVSTLSANLYQGSFNGSVRVNAQQTTPAFSAAASVSGVDAGALLKDAAGLDMVEGRASLSFNFATRGNTTSALKQGANGNAKFDLAKLVIRQADASYAGELKGGAQIDGGKQTLNADVAGNVQRSRFSAKVALRDFDDPAIRFDVDIDQLDADQYLPKSQPAESKKPAAPEQPFDLSALNKLNAEGSLRIGAFKILNLKLAQVRLDMQARKGIVSVKPLAANLYQGSFNGSLGLDSRALPAFTLDGKLSDVAIAPLTKDLLDLDMLEGRSNVSFKLATQGNTVGALMKGLNGDARLELGSGAIRGINLTRLIQNAQNIGKGATSQTLGVSKDDKTEFSEFRASFKVDKGIAHNDDLSVRSPSLHIAGSGDIDIGDSSIDYTAKTTLQNNGQSLMVPVQVGGPFANLKFRLDYAAMLEEIAKQKIKARTDELKEKATEDAKRKLQESLQRGLKGLFK